MALVRRSPTIPPARWAVALLAGSLLVSAYLTVALRAEVSPVANVVSDYVLYRPGNVLFVLAVLLLLAGGVTLVTCLPELGVPRSRLRNVLFGLWATGLLLCAVFPTNRTTGDSTFSGEVHRFAGATFLTSLPLAGWHLARTLRATPRFRGPARTIRLLAIGCLVFAAAFGLCQLAPAPVPDVQGLVERVALGAEVALLLITATTMKRVTA